MKRGNNINIGLTIQLKDKLRPGIAPLFALLLLTFMLVTPSVAWSADLLGIGAIQGLYQQGNYKEVIEALDGEKEDNALQSLYLGLSYLRVEDSGKAIEAWQDYARLEAGSESGRKISRYLSQLIQAETKQRALAAVAQEKSLAEHFDAKAIAVTPFQNLGDKAYAPLSKGLAAMIIHDLSQVKTLKVVERLQIQAVLNELKLSKSILVDQKTAPKLGKLVGAGRVTTGSLLDLEGAMRLDAEVTRTESGQILTSPKAEGRIVAFYKIEKTLVFKILCGIGQCPESLDSRTRLAVEKIHTKNFRAFQHYSEGLDFFDQGRYREASRAFFLALEEDPQFSLARTALLETPVLQLDLTAIISGGDAIGEGEAPVIDFKAIAASQQIGSGISSAEIVSSSAGEDPFPASRSSGLRPLISQQSVGNGRGIPRGGAASAPVVIQLQLP